MSFVLNKYTLLADEYIIESLFLKSDFPNLIALLRLYYVYNTEEEELLKLKW